MGAFMGGGSSLPSLTQSTESKAEATTDIANKFDTRLSTGSFNVGGMPTWGYIALAGLGVVALYVFMKGR